MTAPRSWEGRTSSPPGDRGRRIVMLGAGGTSVDFSEAAVAAGNEVLGFLDDRDPAGEAPFPVLGPLAAWKDLPSEVKFFCGIGSVASHKQRLDLLERLAIPLERFAVIVHPAAVISPTAVLGAGSGVLALATLGARVRLGRHVEVLQSCVVGHDCRVGDGAILAGGANLAGGVSVGRCAYIGGGACVRNGLRVGDRALLGMNSTLLERLPDDAVYVGSPAQPVGTRVE